MSRRLRSAPATNISVPLQVAGQPLADWITLPFTGSSVETCSASLASSVWDLVDNDGVDDGLRAQLGLAWEQVHPPGSPIPEAGPAVACGLGPVLFMPWAPAPDLPPGAFDLDLVTRLVGTAAYIYSDPPVPETGRREDRFFGPDSIELLLDNELRATQRVLPDGTVTRPAEGMGVRLTRGAPVTNAAIKEAHDTREQLVQFRERTGIDLTRTTTMRTILYLEHHSFVDIFDAFSVPATGSADEWAWAFTRCRQSRPLTPVEATRVCNALLDAPLDRETWPVCVRLHSEYMGLTADTDADTDGVRGDDLVLRSLIRDSFMSAISRAPASRDSISQVAGSHEFADKLGELIVDDREILDHESEVADAWTAWNTIITGAVPDHVISSTALSFCLCGVAETQIATLQLLTEHFQPLLATHRPLPDHWRHHHEFVGPDNTLVPGWSTNVFNHMVDCWISLDRTNPDVAALHDSMTLLFGPSLFDRFPDDAFDTHFGTQFVTRADPDTATSAEFRRHAVGLSVLAAYRNATAATCGRFDTAAISSFLATTSVHPEVVDTLAEIRNAACVDAGLGGADSYVDALFDWLNSPASLGFCDHLQSAELAAMKARAREVVWTVTPQRLHELEGWFLTYDIIVKATQILDEFSAEPGDAWLADLEVQTGSGPLDPLQVGSVRQGLKLIKGGNGMHKVLMASDETQLKALASRLCVQRRLAGVTHANGAHILTQPELQIQNRLREVEAGTLPRSWTHGVVFLITVTSLIQVHEQWTAVGIPDGDDWFDESVGYLSPVRDVAGGLIDLSRYGTWLIAARLPDPASSSPGVLAPLIGNASASLTTIANLFGIFSAGVSTFTNFYSAYEAWEDGKPVKASARAVAGGASAVAGVALVLAASGVGLPALPAIAAGASLVAAGVVMAQMVGSAWWDSYAVQFQHDTVADARMMFHQEVWILLPFDAMLTDDLPALPVAGDPIGPGTPVARASSSTGSVLPGVYLWPTSEEFELLFDDTSEGIHVVFAQVNEIPAPAEDADARWALTSPFPSELLATGRRLGLRVATEDVFRVRPQFEVWYGDPPSEFNPCFVAEGQAVDTDTLLGRVDGLDQYPIRAGVVALIETDGEHVTRIRIESTP